MVRRICLSMVFVGALVQPSFAQQDEVTTRKQEKPLKGNIKQESAKGILIGKESLAAEDIVDIFYEATPTSVNIQSNRPATVLEKDLDSKDPKKVEKRKDNLLEAIKKHEETAAKTDRPAAKRHSEYKVAWLRARQVAEDDAPPELALSRLQDFVKNHPDSWQITRVLQRLASMQVEQKDYEGAEDSLKKLAALDLSEEAKQDAELQAATVFLRMDKKEPGAQKRYLDAQKRVQDLARSQGQDSKFAMRLKIAEAECQGKAGQAPAATAQLRGLIKGLTDKNLKAAAYNALGVTLYDAGQAKDARWEFLWVDVVYNQDKVEHAKALYYLAKIFEELGEPERSQECRQLLLETREFLGLEYQRLAQRLAAPAVKTP